MEVMPAGKDSGLTEEGNTGEPCCDQTSYGSIVASTSQHDTHSAILITIIITNIIIIIIVVETPPT